MSSRAPEKRFGNLAVDPSSAKANELFCFVRLIYFIFLASLSPFISRLVPNYRLEGQRRVRSTMEASHGAFTGRFSAGYYNTVGSKEGGNLPSIPFSRSACPDRMDTVY